MSAQVWIFHEMLEQVLQEGLISRHQAFLIDQHTLDRPAEPMPPPLEPAWLMIYLFFQEGMTRN